MGEIVACPAFGKDILRAESDGIIGPAMQSLGGEFLVGLDFLGIGVGIGCEGDGRMTTALGFGSYPHVDSGRCGRGA